MSGATSRLLLVAMAAAGFASMYVSPSWAESSATFYLQAEGCGNGTTEELRKSLSIELAAKHVEQAIANTRVILRCDALSALMTVDDRLTQEPVNRHIDLSGSDELAWSRLLAVAIAETIRWRWAETKAMASANTAPSAEASSAVSVAAPTIVAAAPPPSPLPYSHGADFKLAICILRLNGLGEISGLWGAALRAMRRFGPIAVSLDAQFATGETSTPRVRIVSHFPSLAVMAGPHIDGRLLTFGLEFGGRGGVGLFSGDPIDPSLRGSSMRASWGGPLARAAVAAKMPNLLRLGAAVETGWMLAPITASIADEQQVQWRGGWLSLQLSMGFAFQ